ncbi:MAG TPA: hypothetical protein VEJ67_09335 [Candidatus Cybelea sp.]|nr:hypothetical protein [Candidatus Cybelea sp.]
MPRWFASVKNWNPAWLPILAALALGASPASARQIQKQFQVGDRPIVTIHNPNGTVTVKAWTKSEVLVMADLASSETEVGAEQNGDHIDIVTVGDNVSPDDLRTDYQVNVPENAEVQIHDDYGLVSVANVLGNLDIESLVAGVELQDVAGYLTVKTVAGSFSCLRCAGRIEANSTSGNFKFVDTRSKHVRAQTMTGNILFSGEFLPDGEYRLRNYSGVIEVRFSPGDSFDLSATSLKGRVTNEAKLVPPTHSYRSPVQEGNALIGTYNTAGRARVDLSSFDGTINVVKR